MSGWDHPEPFVVTVRVAPEHVDELGHTNNVHYLDWLQQCAWAHSAAVGFDAEQMLELGFAMVVRTVQMDYLAATFAGDELEVGDWLVENDGRLRATRAFQILRRDDGATIMRARIGYVCMHVESGRARRMPPEFVAAYEALSS